MIPTIPKTDVKVTQGSKWGTTFPADNIVSAPFTSDILPVTLLRKISLTRHVPERKKCKLGLPG